MLERLEAAFEHERRFVADASHELRTPLALLRTELELALRHPRTRAELEDALRSAAEETERLTALAEDLLLIARADQGALPIQPRARRRPRAARRRRRRGSRRAPRRSGGRSRSSRATTSRSTPTRAARAGAREPRRQRARPRPRHGRALGRCRAAAGSSCTCTDEGAGLPARASRARAFDRFSRADEARPRRRQRARARDRADDRAARTAAAPACRTAPATARRLDRAPARTPARCGTRPRRVAPTAELEQRRLQRLLERLARVGRARDELDVRALGAQELLPEHRERLRHDVLRAVGVVAVAARRDPCSGSSSCRRWS